MSGSGILEQGGFANFLCLPTDVGKHGLAVMMEDGSLDKRRQYPRHEVAWNVEVQMEPGISVRATTVNASEGGICIRFPGPMSGETCTVILDPERSAPLAIRAQSRWSSEPDSSGVARIGLQFLGLRPETRARLRSLLKR